MSRRLFSFLLVLASLLGLLSLEYVHEQLTPIIIPSVTASPQMRAQPFSFPVQIPEGTSRSMIWFTIERNRYAATKITLHVDDCLDRLVVNSKVVSEILAGQCFYPEGKVIDLSNYLTPGTNHAIAHVRNNAEHGVFMITPARSDVRLLGIRALQWILGCATLAYLALFTPLGVRYFPLVCSFCIGALLRAMYVAVTPTSLRDHDGLAHLQYVHYVSQHWSIPHHSAGWEFHQPPLYYFLAASLDWILPRSALGFHSLERLLVSLSFSLSLLSLVCMLAVAPVVLPKMKVRVTRNAGFWTYGLLCASYPALVFQSASVGNDIAVLFLASAFTYFLFWWWHTTNIHYWRVLSLVLGLGLLTKLNAALLLPVALISALSRPGQSTARKIRLCVEHILIILGVAGWLFVKRYKLDSQSELIQGANDLLRLGLHTSISALSTFNPLAVLRHPFVDPFSEIHRRSVYWETLLRTSLFGEWQFTQIGTRLCQVELLLAMITLCILIYGIIRFRSSPNEPCLRIALGIPLLGHVLLRVLYPIAPLSNFRYIAFTVPLFALYVSSSFVSDRKARFLRLLVWALIGSFCLFFLRLYLLPLPVYVWRI